MTNKYKNDHVLDVDITEVLLKNLLPDNVVSSSGGVVQVQDGLLVSTTIDNSPGVIKVTDTGVLDSRFGEGKGFVTARFPTPSVPWSSLHILSGNRILLHVVGIDFTTGLFVPGFAQFDHEGKRAEDFGTDGVVWLTDFYPSAQARTAHIVTEEEVDAFLQSSTPRNPSNHGVIEDEGRIVFTFVSQSFFDHTVTRGYVARLQQDGRLDSEFNGVGYTSMPYSDLLYLDPSAIALTSANKYVVSGVLDDVAAFSQLTAEGNIDLSFGDAGFHVVEQYAVSGLAAAVLAASERIVAVGYIREKNSVNSAAMVSLTAEGRRNPDFNQGRDVVISLGEDDSAFSDIVTSLDGRLVTSGFANIGGTVQAVVARFNPDGQPDRTFGEEGVINFADFLPFTGITLRTDSRLVAVGSKLTGADEPPVPVMLMFPVM